MSRLYSPARLWSVFRLLLSFYLLIKKKSRFLGVTPFSPKALAHTITDLGASFIKLAQVLATRNDFFESDYLDSLKTLHDDLPPMPIDAYERVMNRAFPSLPFIRFNPNPIASASIGQVHEAWLDENTKVAVKLDRKSVV